MVLPEIWGETAWNFIHFVTLDYPENPTEIDKARYQNFFYSLQYVLPCSKCRNNLSKHLKKFPLTDEALENRNNLIKWAIDLHNIVNYYTGKRILTYEEALEEIENNMKIKKNNNITLNNLILFMMFIIIIIIIIFCLKKN